MVEPESQPTITVLPLVNVGNAMPRALIEH